jgi:pSer/pThr/pTyr-binding forkhead associated (FHA) protein
LSVRDNSDERFVFDANAVTEIIIGRKDPTTGDSPAIDLTKFDAIEQGVSRRHAAIVRKEGGSLQIVDQGSPNGTFLNGQRLIANQARILRDGDELRLGKLVLSVKFLRE